MRQRRRSTRRTRWALAAPCMLIAACQGISPGGAVDRSAALHERARFPATWDVGANASPAYGQRTMVASNDSLATAAGLEILRLGGNAVDAAVAVGFALAVTYPEAGNIGGGGYMMIRMADGEVGFIDYREAAPAAARRDMFFATGGGVSRESVVGHKASGVPGAVAGLTTAHQRFGKLPLRDVIRPAIRLARDGFVVGTPLAGVVASYESVISRFAGASLFLPGGEPLKAGATLVQHDLARTLQRIADSGAAGFYRGPTARLVAEEMRRGGGLITEADLAAYGAKWRTPIRATYRGHLLLLPPPSTSGGVTIAETLNILETFDTLPAFGSAGYVHLLASSFQRAFIDRNELLGDPDFNVLPVARLTSKGYARHLRRTIDERRAVPSPAARLAMREGNETTHYAVADESGNVVSTTTTINDLFGSGVYVQGAGFFLNDEMDDFTTRPGVPNLFGLIQGEPNTIEPGKRMMSSMSPTIVLDGASRVVLLVGARGGPRIITSTAQVILNIIDHRMGLGDAVRAPRIHHQAFPDSLRVERAGFAPATLDSLSAMGHAIYATPRIGGLIVAIARRGAGWEGVSDQRSSGSAAGY